MRQVHHPLYLRVVVAKKKWWSLLKRMEMEISIGAREKHLTLSMVDFLEKRREDPLNLRTWFATTATSDEWPNKSLAETGCLSSSLRSAARQPASQKKIVEASGEKTRHEQPESHPLTFLS